MLLVRLTEEYCQKFRVKLEPKKTKLLGFSNKSTELLVKLAESNNLITINNVKVSFTTEAEHVGVVRNTAGNMPNLLHRIAEHKKSLGAVLSAGLARGHRGSPAAALRVHQLHCTPVLFSGLATLVLNKAETGIIDKHYQYTIQNLQRLHIKTPRSIVFFLAGSLTGEAILHMRQLAIFSMICHLQDDPLHHHASYVLTFLPPSSNSWFHQVRDLCLQYDLPHPLTLLKKPVPKEQFKRLVKVKVTEYWQYTLASECSSPAMTSLRYFNPFKASLQHPHPMWTSSAGNSFECSKSTVLARMVSGRYRTEMMCRFWSTNRNGYCLSDTCQHVSGDLEHLLIVCPALDHIRHRLHSLWCQKTVLCTPLHDLILKILGSSSETQVRFILDSTAFPEVINLVQTLGQEIEDTVMYLTRTWAFTIHRQKLKMLGRWPEGRTEKKASNHHDPLTLTNNTNHDFNNTSDTIEDAINNNISSGLDMNNTISIPGCLTVPLPSSTTPLLTTTTTTTSSTEQRRVSLCVPTTTSSIIPCYDHPSDSVPRKMLDTNQICSANDVDEEDKTGPGLRGSLPDVGASHSDDQGYQQSVSAIESFLQSFKMSTQCSQHQLALE